jgi:hypothetical protein
MQLYHLLIVILYFYSRVWYIRIREHTAQQPGHNKSLLEPASILNGQFSSVRCNISSITVSYNAAVCILCMRPIVLVAS